MWLLLVQPGERTSYHSYVVGCKARGTVLADFILVLMVGFMYKILVFC